MFLQDGFSFVLNHFFLGRAFWEKHSRTDGRTNFGCYRAIFFFSNAPSSELSSSK
jgi:hypothetical protein